MKLADVLLRRARATETGVAGRIRHITNDVAVALGAAPGTVTILTVPSDRLYVVHGGWCGHNDTTGHYLNLSWISGSELRSYLWGGSVSYAPMPDGYSKITLGSSAGTGYLRRQLPFVMQPGDALTAAWQTVFAADGTLAHRVHIQELML